jgi:hypothetical protein
MGDLGVLINEAVPPGGTTTPHRRGRRSILKAVLGLAIALVTVSTVIVASPAPAQAANGGDFDPGRIMSDSVFYAYGSLGVDQAQAFLNSKSTGCAAGYTCLKDYAQATPNMPADRYCSGYAASGRDTAAAIIVKSAVACGISPKVLIVLLQKEQSLVTATSPSPGTYGAATGFNCPDTAPCNPAYANFAYQVYYAARQFQVYAQNPATFNYRAGATHNIQYKPGTNCGTQSVHVQNQATANLYIYTPYVPNAAALANLYGTGDGCSSYGNRNFWRIYTDWFGSTISGLDTKDAVSLIYSLYSDILLRAPDEGGVNTWRNYLIGQGWPTLTVANAILYSDEYYLQRIDAAYREILGREPDAPGRADWLYRMQTRQVSVDEIRLNFTRSMEYYLNSGGTEASFVSVLYTTMLKRPAVQSDLDYWVTMSRQYGSGYVVTSIWNSYESGTIRLNTVYQGYLHRDVDSDGIRSWVPLITAQGDQAARSALVGSLEYLLSARVRYPQP